MAEYIEREALLKKMLGLHTIPVYIGHVTDEDKMFETMVEVVEEQPTADVVEVVRCKDCKHFQPAFVQTNDGERRPYTEEEKQSGFGLVSAEKGINCGSRCERFGCWEQNSIPVWFSENDYCSYGERRCEDDS